MSPTEWREWTDLVRAFVPLGWPLVLLVIAVLFRRPIEAAVSRATHVGAKLPGGEIDIDLGQKLEDVSQEITAASKETAERVRLAGEGQGISAQLAETTEDVETVRAVEAESPTAALALVGIYIEKALREIARSSGTSVSTWSLGGFVTALEDNGVLPPHLARALRGFVPIRNQLVHGVEMDDETVRRAVDLGLDLLLNVRALARLQEGDANKPAGRQQG